MNDNLKYMSFEMLKYTYFTTISILLSNHLKNFAHRYTHTKIIVVLRDKF